MFVTSISFRGTSESFWDLTGKSTILVQSVLLWISQPDFQNQSIANRLNCGLQNNSDFLPDKFSHKKTTKKIFDLFLDVSQSLQVLCSFVALSRAHAGTKSQNLENSHYLGCLEYYFRVRWGVCSFVLIFNLIFMIVFQQHQSAANRGNGRIVKKISNFSIDQKKVFFSWSSLWLGHRVSSCVHLLHFRARALLLWLSKQEQTLHYRPFLILKVRKIVEKNWQFFECMWWYILREMGYFWDSCNC